jgi:hypothetical protein
MIAVRTPHECGAENLHDRRDDIARQEGPQDQLRRNRTVFPPNALDHLGEQHINRCAEEDGRHDNKEVLHHEVGNRVRIFLRRELAHDVPDDFHECPETEQQEVPCFVFGDDVGVAYECDGEENDAQGGEGDGWGVTIDLKRSAGFRASISWFSTYDNAGIVAVVWIGETWVNIAMDLGTIIRAMPGLEARNTVWN